MALNTVRPSRLALAGVIAAGSTPATLTGAPAEDLVVAFCRHTEAAPPCLCSIETIETPLSPREFRAILDELVAAGRVSASERDGIMAESRPACAPQRPEAPAQVAARRRPRSPVQ